MTLANARPQVAALAIKVNVEKAEVFVDGKSVGFAPLVDGLFVEPGTRKIEARLPGYEAATEMVEAMKNGSIEVALTLRKPIPLPPPSDAAPLRLPQKDGPKTGLLVVGGVTAGTALVAGVVFTVMSNGKSSDADSLASSLKGLGAPRPCQSNADACAAIDSTPRPRCFRERSNGRVHHRGRPGIWNHRVCLVCSAWPTWRGEQGCRGAGGSYAH